MHTFTKLLADGLMIPIALVAVYAFLWKVPKEVRYDRYTRIVMGGLTSYLLAKFAGALWQPEKLRPFEQMGVSAGASFLNNPGFPSDHALFAAFLTLAVWYATRSRNLTLVMAAMTIAVCVGRVLALVHTPLDIVGGLVIALLGTVWYKPSLGVAKQKVLAKKSRK